MRSYTKRRQEKPKAQPGDFDGMFSSDICKVINLALTMTDDEKQHGLDVIRGVRSAATADKARRMKAEKDGTEGAKA